MCSAFSIRRRRRSACCSLVGTMAAAARKPAIAPAARVVHGATCIHARGSTPCARSCLMSSETRAMAALASAACLVRNSASVVLLSGALGALFDVGAELGALLLL